MTDDVPPSPPVATRASSPPRFVFVAAIIVAIGAFAFRFLSLRSLSNDHYLYLAWAQQLTLGEIPGRDFVEPGVPLQAFLSALAQLAAPAPATEGALTAAMLALAAAATCVAVAWLTRSVAVGVLAAAFQVLSYPRLYSYPKIMVPAVLALLALRYARRPGLSSLLMMAGCISAAFLLRHDLGAYAAIAGVIAVGLSHSTPARAARECVRLAVAVLLMLAPYFAFLEWNGGIVEHVRGGLEYSKSEATQFEYAWPVFGFGAERPDSALPWDPNDATAFLSYSAWLLPPLAALLLVARKELRRDVVVRAAVAATIGMAIFYDVVLLRHPLIARIQDLAAVVAILGAWSAMSLVQLAGSLRVRPIRAAATRLVLAAWVAVAVLSLEVLANVREEVAETRMLDGLGAIRARAADVMASGGSWPAEEFWPAGPLPEAIGYLRACTRPEDRVLLTWLAPEYYVFARRGFGAGHATLLAPHAYTSPSDQQLMVSRLVKNRVPLVFINESMRDEFASTYPMLDEHLRNEYAKVGEFTIRGGAIISIALREGVTATDSYGDERWPCGLVAQ